MKIRHFNELVLGRYDELQIQLFQELYKKHPILSEIITLLYYFEVSREIARAESEAELGDYGYATHDEYGRETPEYASLKDFINNGFDEYENLDVAALRDKILTMKIL